MTVKILKMSEEALLERLFEFKGESFYKQLCAMVWWDSGGKHKKIHRIICNFWPTREEQAKLPLGKLRKALRHVGYSADGARNRAKLSNKETEFSRERPRNYKSRKYV